ncbi:Bicoid-interacting protein 3-domain-containing protein [Phycomyces blakesleeanus]|uniref:RNA methyltransferase n=1 Tax=Phycomyces blakesleeanus TaxID=4837 RepID=A0ABR3BG46_PHYBL
MNQELFSKRKNPYGSDEYEDPANNLKYQRMDYRTESKASYLGGKTGVELQLDGNQPPPKFPHKYIYGNYKNYYEDRRNKYKHHDPRLDLLDVSLFKNKDVLDIGCNSGNITIFISRRYQPKSILGVDIDKDLIRKAKMQTKIDYALQDPSEEKQQGPIDLCMRFSYFPKSMSHMFGYSFMTLPPTADYTGFPVNTTFEDGDWVDMDVEPESYDTIMALSVTKWIQLHRGDEGIKMFFKKVYKSLKPGGSFVVEPQPFDTYYRRAKQTEETRFIFEGLSFTPDQYEPYLLKLGFSSVKHLGKSLNDNKGFKRPLELYTK